MNTGERNTGETLSVILISVFNHPPPGHTGFDFNQTPPVMVNWIAVLAMVTDCKG